MNHFGKAIEANEGAAVSAAGEGKATGMTAHIAISVAGILVLVAYTAATKKEWEIPALEILMRACCGIALISGIVIMNVHGFAVLSVAHKAGAGLFVLLLVVLFVHKSLKMRAKTTEK